MLNLGKQLLLYCLHNMKISSYNTSVMDVPASDAGDVEAGTLFGVWTSAGYASRMTFKRSLVTRNSYLVFVQIWKYAPAWGDILSKAQALWGIPMRSCWSRTHRISHRQGRQKNSQGPCMRSTRARVKQYTQDSSTLLWSHIRGVSLINEFHILHKCLILFIFPRKRTTYFHAENRWNHWK